MTFQGTSLLLEKENNIVTAVSLLPLLPFLLPKPLCWTLSAFCGGFRLLIPWARRTFRQQALKQVHSPNLSGLLSQTLDVPVGRIQDLEQAHTSTMWALHVHGWQVVGKMYPGPRFTAKCTKFVEVAFLVVSLITGHLHSRFAGMESEHGFACPTSVRTQPGDSGRLVDGYQVLFPDSISPSLFLPTSTCTLESYLAR